MWEWDRENDEPNQEIAAIDYEAPDNRVADAQAEDLGESGEWTVPRKVVRRTQVSVPPGLWKEVNSVDRLMVNGNEVNQLMHGWEGIRVQVDSGAIDTVAPRSVGKAFNLRETVMSKNNVGFVAANGSKISNFGERTVIGFTDDEEAVSMRMTCADVHKVLGLCTV